MRWIDYSRGIIVAPLVVSGMVAFGCGGSSTSAPPAAPVAPSTSAGEVASASPAPAPAAAPAASESSAAAAPSEASAQEEEDAAGELVEHHRHHHHGGVARFIAMSLDTLGTTPEQHAAIEQIQTVLRTKLEPARVAEQKVVTLLADGVAAGKIDKPKVDAAIARVGTASEGVHAALIDALNQLHSVLDDAQRKALVGKVEAHWQVWKEANAGGAAAIEPHEHGRIEGLAKDLSLTSDQVDKIRISLRATEGKSHFDDAKAAAHITAFGTAFEAPSFDAKALKSGDGVNAHLASWGATSMAHFYEAITPVLTPEQRTKLADRVREHANHET